LNQTLNGLANVVIPPLGALAVVLLPMSAIMAVDVITALPAVVTLAVVSIPQPRSSSFRDHHGSSSVWADLVTGIRFLRGWDGLLLFSSIGTVSNMLGRAAAALTPLVVIQHFDGGPLELGWMQSAAGIGALLGGVLLGIWGGFDRRIVTAMVALTVDGVALTVFGLSPSGALWLAVGAVSVAGFAETVVVAVNGALFQAAVPPDMQGRVFSLLISASQVATPLGLAIAGPVSDIIGAQTWYLLAGLAILIMGAGALAVPSIMSLEERGGSQALS
jgi:DHA3 family macrolide efflux protein-like MFS transporter